MEEPKRGWQDIFKSFRMAFDPKKLILGFCGIMVSLVLVLVSIAISNKLGLVSISPKSIINGAVFSSNLCPYEMVLVFCRSMMVFSAGKMIVSLLLLLGLLCVWSVVGGAITRIAALEYAKDESLRLIDALKFSVKKFWSYFWSPCIPAIGVILFALFNVLGGFIGKFGGVGNMFVAFGFPLAIILSLMIAFIGVVGVIGMCLMFPTISAEGSDAFDAMSRAYSYVLSKPKKYILYFFTTTISTIFFVIFVGFVVSFVINITFDTVGIGMGEKFKNIVATVKIHPNYCSIVGTNITSFKAGLSSLPGLSEKLVACSIMLCLIFLKVGVAGFAVAYLASAKTIVYFLMRRDVDETDISDVYIENECINDEEDQSEESDADKKEETEQ